MAYLSTIIHPEPWEKNRHFRVQLSIYFKASLSAKIRTNYHNQKLVLNVKWRLRGNSVIVFLQLTDANMIPRQSKSTNMIPRQSKSSKRRHGPACGDILPRKTRSSNKLRLPTVRLECTKKAFFYHGCVIFNQNF